MIKTTFPKERTDEIRTALEKMQFTDVERILSRMEQMEDPNDPMAKACIFQELPLSENTFSDLFFVIKQRPDGHWFIDGLLAWVQMATGRTEEGFMDVEKAYPNGDDPLPTVDQIKTDLGLLVQYEEHFELFFVKNDLDLDLQDIGFRNVSTMLRSARQSDNFVYLEAKEKIGGDGPNAADSIHFEFVVMADNIQGTAKLFMIRAFLDTQSPNAAAIKESTQTAFYPLDSQFPKKEAMIQEVLSQLTLDKSQQKVPVKSIFSTNHSEGGLKRLIHRRP